jgi:alpha-glucosidase
LGWRPLPLVRNGTVFHMRNRPTYDEPEVFYSGVPLWYGIRGGRAYGLFFNDASWGTIDLSTSEAGYISFRNPGGPMDYYYFAGPEPGGILDRFTALTGRPFMPPRWSLGYHQCRWSYTPQSQLLDIADELRRREIPADVIYLDVDYMPDGMALQFDPERFPDAAGAIAELHRKGFHVVTNISPLLLRHDPKCAEAVRKGYVLRRANGTPLWGRHFYWPEFRGAPSGDAVWIDFTNSEARRWWAKQHEAFMACGVDGIWNDVNEPDELGGDWPADVQYDSDGDPVEHCRISTQYAMFQVELSREILARHAPDRRPFILSRGGYAGIQRYAALWTGDNSGGWEDHFRLNIPMGLSMSLCGNPNTGHDIGGFFGWPEHGDAPPAELYVRWMQAGAFYPLCRQHRDGFGNHPDRPRPFTEPWRFGPRVEDICRSFIRLRYRLMPYLYTLFHNAHVTGEPVQRPTLFDFPNDPATLEQDYDFMFGPFLLISPVTQPGATEWSTYLPAGVSWIDWWSDATYAGGQVVTTSAPLERMPIFVREGAIIPTGPVYQHEGAGPFDRLTLELYPGRTSSQFTLYEDDGISLAYQKGVSCQTTFEVSRGEDGFKCILHAREGMYEPAPRIMELIFHRIGHRPGRVMQDDKPLTGHEDCASLESAGRGWWFDQGASLLHVLLADAAHGTEIRAT